MSSLAELSASRDLMANLTLRELRSKYKRSVLGWTWSLVNPLATMAIFTVVFSIFLKVKPPAGNPSRLKGFAFFLLVGLLPWNFLSNGINGTLRALIANANLLKKVYFPREILVAANVVSWVVSFLIEMGVLAVVLLIAGNFVVPWLAPTLLIVVLQAFFVLGIGLGLSVLNVYFRDIEHLMGIVLQLWFYATPIVYPETVLPKSHLVRTLYGLNPMVRFVRAYRNCLYDLRLPALGDIAFLVVVTAAALVAGLLLFRRFEPKLAEEL